VHAQLAMLSLVLLVGLTIAADPIQSTTEEIKFKYEDSVTGHGNFASNNKIVAQGPHSDARIYGRLADVYLQKKDHGSGSIDRELVIKSNEFLKKETNPDMIYSYGLIAALGNSSLVYDPQNMPIGNGYYAAHPVNFSSLLGDMIHIKNYASKTSMGQVLEQAHAINIDLLANVEDDYSGSDWDSTKGLTRTFMNLNGDITSGTAHLTMLQGGTRRSKIAWSKPDIDLDQVYTGTFDFATKMNLTLPVYKSVSADSWLPCCSDGWSDLMYSYKKDFGVDAKEIFDCTCPKGLTKA
jgi:hypothetical protein